MGFVKERLIIVLTILISTISSYSQTENEYQESSFQGSEEQSYNPKKEVFLIYSANISNKYSVFGKLPNKNNYSITVDYEKDILTLKLGTVSESYKIQLIFSSLDNLENPDTALFIIYLLNELQR